MFKPLNQSQRRKTASRVLIIGPPNSRKTTSLMTWDRPTHILVMPGEKGSATIPMMDGILPYVWETEPDEEVGPHKVWNQLQVMTKEILSGKRGPITTFAGDGLHKVYQVIYDMHLLDLVASGEAKAQKKGYEFDVEDVGGRAYGYAHKTFLNYLTMVNQSPVEYVVFTCWSAREKEDPDVKKSASFVWPDLPGQAAQWVLGEFSVVLYSEVGNPMPDGRATAKWVLRPGGQVKGVGVKTPVETATRMPASVPQDWQVLKKILLGQEPVVGEGDAK